MVGLGFELVGVEIQSAKQPLLRIYIDHADGITLEGCTEVSRQVSAVLDVEDPIPGNYLLEVSSPGLDRPLFRLEDYDRFAGSRAKILFHAPLEGRQHITGVLGGVIDQDIVMDIDTGQVRIPLDHVKRARLVPEY